MNNQNLGVARECERTVRNNEYTQEGYLYRNALKFCAFVQNVGMDVY